MCSEIEIVEVDKKSEKYRIVIEILNDLPEWFGIKESIINYGIEAKDLKLWAALKEDDYIGFITLKATSPHTGEIDCMGVKKKYHGMGIGKSLFNHLNDYAKEEYEYLQVKTIDEGNYKEYDRTVEFYRSMGFLKLEVFPDLWDEGNPCLIMIMKV